ncbi:MAG: hypothetical protein Q8N77_02620 [Nanoarchaeota archaeon]|nr:hypothetical protein [Nanoarchaeota archaeon]
MPKKLEEIIINGVVIDSEGSAVQPKIAERDHGITPDIVFIRDDGWTLGAPKIYEDIAYKLWSDYWTHFATKEEKKKRPISEYASYKTAKV